MFRSRYSLLSSGAAMVALALAAGPAAAQIYQGYPAPMNGGGSYSSTPRFSRGYWPNYVPVVTIPAPVVYQAPAVPPAPAEVYTLTSAERDRNAALIDVRVPHSGAEVWVSDEKTRQRGTLRYFVTDDLKANQEYDFPIKVRWLEDGKSQERTRIIAVHTGDHVVVDFTRPAEAVKATLHAAHGKSQ